MVQGCRRRDRACQRALYELTSTRIYPLLLRMLRNAEDAADVMQDTYIRVFERFDQFQEESGVGTWVYRVAVNEALQFLRKAKRRDRFADSLLGSNPSADDSGPVEVDMRDALDQLPEAERTLLVLKYYEGLNYAEMAKVLDKPSGTIASGLNRARDLLRHLLDKPSKTRTGSEETANSNHPME